MPAASSQPPVFHQRGYGPFLCPPVVSSWLARHFRCGNRKDSRGTTAQPKLATLCFGRACHSCSSVLVWAGPAELWGNRRRQLSQSYFVFFFSPEQVPSLGTFGVGLSRPR